jgi:protein involved in polysaccharide export with SLBB domain
MHAGCRTALLVSAFLTLATTAWAQPVPEPYPAEPSISGNTQIPVTVRGTEVLGAESTASSSAAAPVSLEQPIDPDTYVCGSGDTFELNFWGQQNFRLKIAVDLEGRTFISKVGFLSVAGKTLNEVRSLVKKKVGKIYPGLQFDLTLVSPRTFVVHVVDFVKTPGAYTATPLDRVANVLNRAGGSTGSRRRITIRHKNGSETAADLVLYELTGDTKLNPFLLDGDVVTVPAATTVATISGAVRRPGAYELVKTKDLVELVQLAGGFTSSAARALPIRLIRRNEQNHEVSMELRFAGDAAPAQALRDDDAIIVPSAQEMQRTVLLIGAVVGTDAIDAAATSKRLPFVEGDTVRSLIERAGGITAPGDLSRAYISRRGDAGETIVPVDLNALLVKRDFSADKKILIGDTIVVPPMRYSIRVEGAVTRSGVYNYNPLFSVPEYIAHAGGMTRSAQALGDVRVVAPNGKTQTYHSGLKISPGDAILVPERNFTRAELVQIVIAGAGLILSGVAVTLAATR